MIEAVKRGYLLKHLTSGIINEDLLFVRSLMLIQSLSQRACVKIMVSTNIHAKILPSSNCLSVNWLKCHCHLKDHCNKLWTPYLYHPIFQYKIVFHRHLSKFLLTATKTCPELSFPWLKEIACCAKFIQNPIRLSPLGACPFFDQNNPRYCTKSF